jgi:hypothetical protein
MLQGLLPELSQSVGRYVLQPGGEEGDIAGVAELVKGSAAGS